MSDLDQEFMDLANEEQANQVRPESVVGGSNKGDYETIYWAGLEPKKIRPIRFLGNNPQARNLGPYDAKIVNFAWIKGDDGKNFRSILPPYEDNQNHLMWRIISKVNEVTFINKKKVALHSDKKCHGIVNKNGLASSDKRFKYEKGWAGKNVMIANVLDREDMEWHRENKHTKLLSRNIFVNAEGREYPEDGVPVFGLYQAIVQSIFKHYGSWEKYDIGIERTGETQPAYKVYNASKLAEAGLPEVASIQDSIVVAPLTEEEASWERYDISKIYRFTSFTKYFNKLKSTIKLIDSELGTNFYEEFQDEVAEEKIAREAEKARKEEAADFNERPNTATAEKAEADTVVEAEQPVRESRTRETAKLEVDTTGDGYAPGTEALPYFDKLPEEHKRMFVSVTLDKNGKPIDATYNVPEGERIFDCSNSKADCKFPSPESFTMCPNCGEQF